MIQICQRPNDLVGKKSTTTIIGIEKSHQHSLVVCRLRIIFLNHVLCGKNVKRKYAFFLSVYLLKLEDNIEAALTHFFLSTFL